MKKENDNFALLEFELPDLTCPEQTGEAESKQWVLLQMRDREKEIDIAFF